MIIALAGNQNSGKTTLFNHLTGASQHVGNFPGVTVEQKQGTVQGHSQMVLVDLPGIYSLRPYSGEEVVTRDFLLSGVPQGIVNIVDGGNLERNLYLTLQLKEMGLPMVLALNMMDEVRENGGGVDTAGLSRALGIPVVPVSAAKDEGLDLLLHSLLEVVRKRQRPRPHKYPGALERCIQGVETLVKSAAEQATIPPRFAAVRLLEGDAPILQQLGLRRPELELFQELAGDMEKALGTDRHTAVATARYDIIEQACGQYVKKGRTGKGRLRSMALDRILTGRYTALPVFFSLMLAVFWLTFGLVGTGLSDLLVRGIDGFTGWLEALLAQYGLNPVLRSLLTEGVLAGVGSVLSFLPIILTLFFFLSILEDTGYMARVAFIMDKPLQKIGLSGRSFVPMVIGFGCTVPAVLATRTLSGEREQKMTILLIPFMSCTAKLPIYAVFTAAFFPRHQTLVMMLLYILGACVGMLCGALLSKTAFRDSDTPFIMELPNYRLPSLKSVCILMWEKAKDFLVRAFTVIMLASIVIWTLQTFNYQLEVVEDSAHSLLGTLSMAVTPLLYPLGLRDWRITVALITGFTAKEMVISTLAVLTGASAAELTETLPRLFTPLSACSFLTFTLLYTPCVAAIAAIARELRSSLAALQVVLLQCGIAWAAAALVYQVGRLMGFS